MLAASFDATGGANECTLASGDSGGGVFIQEDSVWKLAGISYAVDGPFSLTDSGAAFNAAVFDVGGLYALENATFVLIVDNAADQPGSFYSTRISSRMDWIRSVVASPQPPDLAPTLQAATGPDGPYTDFSDATVDEASGTITLTPPVSREAQFYRLRTCAPLRITSVQVLGGHVVLKYGVAMGEVFAHP